MGGTSTTLHVSPAASMIFLRSWISSGVHTSPMAYECSAVTMPVAPACMRKRAAAAPPHTHKRGRGEERTARRIMHGHTPPAPPHSCLTFAVRAAVKETRCIGAHLFDVRQRHRVLRAVPSPCLLHRGGGLGVAGKQASGAGLWASWLLGGVMGALATLSCSLPTPCKVSRSPSCKIRCYSSATTPNEQTAGQPSPHNPYRPPPTTPTMSATAVRHTARVAATGSLPARAGAAGQQRRSLASSPARGSAELSARQVRESGSARVQGTGQGRWPAPHPSSTAWPCPRR